MTMRVFTVEQATEWKETLNRAQRHDFYHLPQYHALAQGQGEGQARLFVYEEGDNLAALPLLLRSIPAEPWAQRPDGQWQDATSVYGFPGPIANTADLSPEFLGRFHQALAEQLHARGVIAVFSRLNPLLDQKGLVEGLGEFRPLGQTVSLDLAVSAEDQLAGYHRSHRQDVLRLRRNGFVCQRDDNLDYLEDFSTIYQETMRRVGAQPNYFFGQDFFRGLLSDSVHHSHLFVVHKENQVASAAMFLECGGIMQYYLSGTANGLLKHSPIKLLLDDTSRWARDRGLRVLHLGGGLGAGMDSLFRFKAGFSSRRHDFGVWRWVLRPELYDDLCLARSQWAARQGMQGSDDFFPAYRSPLSPAAVA